MDDEARMMKGRHGTSDGQVTKNLEELDEALRVLKEDLIQLEDEIDMVLMPGGKGDFDGPEGVRYPLNKVGLAHLIFERVLEVWQIAERVNWIRERVSI